MFSKLFDDEPPYFLNNKGKMMMNEEIMMKLEDLRDHSDYIEAEFQSKLVQEYGKVIKVGPFQEETLAMLLEHHEEWYKMALASYRRRLVDKGEYAQGLYGEMYVAGDYREVVNGQAVY